MKAKEFEGLVELGESLSSDERRRVVAWAFEASAKIGGPVGLLLRNEDPEEVDRLLDPLIKEHGHRGPLVYYLDSSDTGNLLRMAARSRFVVAVSEKLKELLGERNIQYVEPELANGMILPEAVLDGAA